MEPAIFARTVACKHLGVLGARRRGAGARALDRAADAVREGRRKAVVQHAARPAIARIEAIERVFE